jgi:hypothetical protein
MPGGAPLEPSPSKKADIRFSSLLAHAILIIDPMLYESRSPCQREGCFPCLMGRWDVHAGYGKVTAEEPPWVQPARWPSVTRGEPKRPMPMEEPMLHSGL